VNAWAGVRRVGWWRPLAFVVLCSLLYLWVRALWQAYQRYGLFRSIGVDWSYYYAQSLVLRSGDPVDIYRLGALGEHLQVLAAFNVQPGVPLPAGHVPYPPLFAWLFTPFTLPDPPVGFALWTVLSAVAALWLTVRVMQQVPVADRLVAAAILLTSVPIIASIATGQVAILLGCVVAEAFIALRAGHDLRAGFWIACLLIKPQYGILLGFLLLWKRRWSTVTGVALGAAVVLSGSLLVAGLPALLAYPNVIAEEDPGLRSIFSRPEVMINWRALVLTLQPEIPETPGLIWTAALSTATAVGALLAWRGPWSATDSGFSVRMTLLLTATLLATYHSHVHGAVLLAVPLAAAVSQRDIGGLTRACLLIATVVPSIAPHLGRLLPAGSLRIFYADAVGFLPALGVLAIAATLSMCLWTRSQAAARRRQEPTCSLVAAHVLQP
jgi:hypothetical protein